MVSMSMAEGDSESCCDRRNCRKALKKRRRSVCAELRPLTLFKETQPTHESERPALCPIVANRGPLHRG